MSLRIAIIPAAFAALLLTTGCAIQARSDTDPRVSLAQCHSYSFGMPVSDRTEPAYANPLNDKRLRDAIAAQLQARGMQAAPEREAGDCLVRYAIGSRLEVDPGTPRFSWGLGLGYGGRRGFGSMAWDMPYAYRDGRVSIDLFDARSHEALWHAYVDEDVTRLTGADADKRISELVQAIFARYPAGGAHL
jgi:hypothetical protein